jgi:hypothetical protein
VRAREGGALALETNDEIVVSVFDASRVSVF